MTKFLPCLIGLITCFWFQKVSGKALVSILMKNLLHRETQNGNFTQFSSKGLILQIWFEGGLKSIRCALIKFVELGPGPRKIGPISGYISTHQLHVSHFQLMTPTTNPVKHLWNLRKFLEGRACQIPRKMG